MDDLKLPKGESGMTRYLTVKGEPKFLLTTKNVGGSPNFYLYKVSGGDMKKLGSGRNPLELEEKFEVEKVLRDG